MDEEDQHRPKRPRLMVRLGRNNSANRTANPENEALSTRMDPEEPGQPELSETPEESEKHDEHETPKELEPPTEPEVERKNNILEQLSTLPRHLEAIGDVGASFGQSVMEKLQNLEAKLDNFGQVRFNRLLQ